AKFTGRGFLTDKKMLFNKRSMDGSGKANLVDSPDDVTWGVIYEIDAQDLDALDRIEGGYDRLPVLVRRLDGDTVEAESYVSRNLADAPVSYEWYKELVLSGAREHNLPQDYIFYLERLPSKPDESKSKAAR
ncbi:gamma-glutamylcyclotransferase, partial [Chloroflexota bacterium]